MNDTSDRELPAELDHWYRVAALRYRQFLESVTALELVAARRHLDLFARLLEGTLAASESGLEEIGPDPSDVEDAKLVRTDYMRLRRSLNRVVEALNQLEELGTQGSALRTALVDRLDTFVRTDNILARHHDRVETYLLPLLDSKLDSSRGREIARTLSTLMALAQPN